MRIGSLLTGWLAVLALAAPAPPAAAESLTQAMAGAYTNNPEINAARAGTRAADENLPLAKSAMRPLVSSAGEVSKSWMEMRTKTPGGYVTSSSSSSDAAVSIRVTQDIFRGFRTKNAILGAKAGVMASRQALRNTVQNVLFDAAEAYMNVLRDDALLSLRRQNVGFLNEQLRAAQDRFEVGENTRTDVAQTRARLSAATSDVSLAESNLKTSRAVYRQVVGRDPNRLTPGFTFGRLLPPSEAAALDIGRKEHPLILAATNNVDIAAFDVKEIEGELLPTVSLEGAASRSVSLDDAGYTNSASVTGRVTVPLYQGGAVSARIRQAKELHGQRRIEVDVAHDQVRAAVVAAWGTLEAARAAIVSARAQVEASTVALTGVQEEQKVGQRTTLDVLDARQELLNAQVSLVVVQRDSVVASFALLSAIGRLNEDRLNLPVARYDPAEHYHAVKDKWFGIRTPDGR